ncbi:MAG TPA: hypothetical protein VK745_18065 [Polyangiaceae bacterium]|nr:hypothetical protein [Polyangiaceae bacterium]
MVHAARSSLALGLAFGVSTFLRSAAAADTCVAPKVNVVVPPGPEWENATEELSQHLRTVGNLDKCAHVLVRPSATGVTLDITTGDGRRATRQVTSVAELLRTAEALLVLPPEPMPPAKPSPLELPPPEPVPIRAPVTTTHIELGGGPSLRFGGGPLYAGGGVAGFADFALDGWLLALSARVDLGDVIVEGPTPSDFHMESSAVGVSVGRRLEFANAGLDALIGPSIVLEGQDADEPEVHGAAADFRLALALRVSGPRSSSIRAFATGDFESSPARMRAQKSISPDLPPLPWWSSGLAVGVLWGVR